jgi:molecular chaperone DnaK
MLYQGEKMVKDFGEKVPEDLKKEFEEKAKKLRTAISSDDFETIKSGSDALQQVIYKISEKVYGSMGQGAGGFDPSQMGGFAGTPPGAGKARKKKKKDEKPPDEEDDAVDVDFEDL